MEKGGRPWIPRDTVFMYEQWTPRRASLFSNIFPIHRLEDPERLASLCVTPISHPCMHA